MCGRLAVLLLAACASPALATADPEEGMTKCADGECAARKAQALLQSKSIAKQAPEEIPEEEFYYVDECISAMPAELPKKRNPGFQKKSWKVGCEHAALTQERSACKEKCDRPQRGCCGTTCTFESCRANDPGGNCCDASRDICIMACDSFLELKEAEAEEESTAASTTTEAYAAPTTTEAYAAPETTAAPTTEAPYAVETTVAPTAPPTGHCTPTCSWQCVSPECERTCKPACQQPQCETRCKKADTTGCSMNCSQPECYTICPKAACKKTENCPMCTTHCSEAVCRMDCPQTQDCENVCEAPVCEWQCDIPEACPQPDCRLDCQEPKDCMNAGISGAPLPALKDGEIKVHSFSSPVNMREPTGASTTGAPGEPGYIAGLLEKSNEVPVMVFTRSRNYMTTLPVSQSVA